MTTTELKQQLRTILCDARARHIASSLSLYVSFGDRHEIELHEGCANQGSATNEDTFYDLASLTKIIGTTFAVADAVRDQKLCLNECPFPLWPNVTIASILAHTAGLSAHRKFYEILPLSSSFQKNYSDILANLFLENPTANSTRLYSDLGFIALGHLLISRIKKPLFDIFADAWRRQNIETRFFWHESRRALSKPITNIAPTGFCSSRNRYLQAEVHDPNCYYMGGLAGHAGLFGSLNDVKTIGHYFLDAWAKSRDETDYLIKHFATKGLGFDKPNKDGTTRYFSRRGFGHFGFTGTSLWMDPDRNLVVALLTNRVHCSSSPEGIFWLRLRINRAIMAN